MCHSPQGECGLKYKLRIALGAQVMSLPARGVWIEMPRLDHRVLAMLVTPRKGSVD